MRVFLAGATGVIGIRLLPLLVSAGHTVAGMTRSSAKVDLVLGLGAEPVLCDVYDAGALNAAVHAFAPDVIVHQLTDLPDDIRELGTQREANSRIRREGTRNLLGAARIAGVRGLIAQSVAWELSGDGGAARDEMEAAVLEFGGVVVRYGQFYGPGTYHETHLPGHPRIQIDQAAKRTLATLGMSHQTVEIVEPVG